MWVYRRTIDPITGEFRRGEYVGYVDTGNTLSGLAALNANAGPPAATANPVKPRLRLVADLREWRAWRRYQRRRYLGLEFQHIQIDLG